MNITNDIFAEDKEVYEGEEYFKDIQKNISPASDIAGSLLNTSKKTFCKIKKMLYSAPAFINIVKASIPKETLQAVFTDEQKSQLTSGALKLMTKKDGSLMASLINPETNKIVSNIPLKSVEISPQITQAMTNFAMQAQMAQIAEQIQVIQAAVEEVRQGQENDRLASAYSCQQKLLQAMEIKNPELKQMALLRIAYDAEDSRNLLMHSQSANVEFAKNQPEKLWEKLISTTSAEKVDARMMEIRESICAVNMVSLVEAVAYQEMGESNAARKSLEYYVEYIDKTYLKNKGLVYRLDSMAPSPDNYLSKTLPDIKNRIKELPSYNEESLIGED